MSSSADSTLLHVLDALAAVRAELVSPEAVPDALLQSVHGDWHESARNLLHYLALRRQDLRPLQLQLAALGLSSLGRAESCVLPTVDAVLQVLRRLAQQAVVEEEPASPLDFAMGHQLLARHSDNLLGAAPAGRSVRIMVTMPSEAASEYSLVHDLLKQGMNVMRINCAHDDAAAWAAMIDNLRRAEVALGLSCRVAMDLAGPKLRTGPLESGPRVLRIRPERDLYGRVTRPARVWLTQVEAPCSPPAPADATLALPAQWLARLRTGDGIRLKDARAARRQWQVADVTTTGCWATLEKTTYLIPGIALRHAPVSAPDPAVPADARVVRIPDLPPRENHLELVAGDLLILTRDQQPGRAAIFDSSGNVLTPATIGCSLPGVFERVRAGESIVFDDGKIGGLIEKVEAERVLVRITRTRPGGARLRADKGINLPDSDLDLPALTAKDCADLAFVAQHADLVQLSFANHAHDVAALLHQLEQQGSRRPAVVLKIETRRGFENLPDMLLTAMRWPTCGVMIARGDLAVECGFERLAEVQEEILWICEAAHVPVIWATQVLETLAREGLPSRAEITDAAMGHRAECVMLNKGPHMLSAVRVLDDILSRMQAHQAKKSSMLRELQLAHTQRMESAEY